MTRGHQNSSVIGCPCPPLAFSALPGIRLRTPCSEKAQDRVLKLISLLERWTFTVTRHSLDFRKRSRRPLSRACALAAQPPRMAAFLEAAHTAALDPPPLEGHTALTHGKSLWLFGGGAYARPSCSITETTCSSALYACLVKAFVVCSLRAASSLPLFSLASFSHATLTQSHFRNRAVMFLFFLLWQLMLRCFFLLCCVVRSFVASFLFVAFALFFFFCFSVQLSTPVRYFALANARRCAGSSTTHVPLSRHDRRADVRVWRSQRHQRSAERSVDARRATDATGVAAGERAVVLVERRTGFFPVRCSTRTLSACERVCFC